jgi:predicted alpha/beta hydrolase
MRTRIAKGEGKTMRDPEEIEIACDDGYKLRGHLWRTDGASQGIVIVNPATGVVARYYHYYARFLTENGFDVLTYDYRGIGLSRPERLRGSGIRWRDWGELDFDAVVRFSKSIDPDGSLLVVGHSIGGIVPGLAESSPLVDRMLTVGAQYAYWRNYAPHRRKRLFLKWHIFMPAITALCGYFPGRRLGWLEDLPAGVANEWTFRKARLELCHPPDQRDQVLRRFSAIKAPILAIGVSDDELAPPPAIESGLAYFTSAEQALVSIAPHDLGHERIGHFGLFHARHRDDFWKMTIPWLTEGRHLWRDKGEAAHERGLALCNEHRS